MTTVLKCLETPAIGSTVSEKAGPEDKGYTRCNIFMHQAVAIYPQNVAQYDKRVIIRITVIDERPKGPIEKRKRN